MNWYYVDAGQQAGPVDDAQLEELLRSGKIQTDTLIWSEGMANWQSYQEVKSPGLRMADAPPIAAPQAVGPNEAVCAECGRVFPQSEVIRFADKWVCAACKPVFFQRLREGAGFVGVGGTVTEADLLARDYQVDIGGCFSRGWDVFKANAGIIIGASVLVYLAIMASGIIPWLGVITALIFAGPLKGGLWYFYVKKVRNQEATVGDAFSGFGPGFWQLTLAQLIPGLISFGIMAVWAMMVGGLVPVLLGGRGGGGRSGSVALSAMFIPLGIGLFLGVLVMIYLTTCWLFALPLVKDKGLKFWPAMQLSRRVVSKHWWMTFWLLVVAWLFAMVGVFACVLGVLVTGPVAFAMLVSHYERVFGDLIPNRD